MRNRINLSLEMMCSIPPTALRPRHYMRSRFSETSQKLLQLDRSPSISYAYILPYACVHTTPISFKSEVRNNVEEKRRDILYPPPL